MVFHVGINPEDGEVTAYNEETQKTLNFFVTEVLSLFFIGDVEAMFIEINTELNGKIGCTCIYLDQYYRTDIRKKFIEKGILHGFRDIQIVDKFTLIYFDRIFQANLQLNTYDLIWIIIKEDFLNKNCYIWERLNSKARLLTFDSISNIFKENFLTVKTKYGIDKNPNLIIYDNAGTKIAEQAPAECKTLYISNSLKKSETALIKARIMAKDSEVLQCDAYVHLEWESEVKINGKKYWEIYGNPSLPIYRSITMKFDENDKILKVSAGDIVHKFYEEKIHVTAEMRQSEGHLFNFLIDENGICSVELSPIEKTVQNLEYCVKHLYSENVDEEKQLYLIPQKAKVPIEVIQVVGIDLGTSRCYAAVKRRNGIETVVLDNTGERQLPSYISFDEENPKCGQLVVNRLQNFAKSTAFDIKRIIGKKFEDIKTDENWPFKVINVEDKIKIQIQDPNGVLEKHPEEISAVLLKHIKQKVEEFQGKEINVIVITVPAAFTEEQKVATRVAGLLQGWKKVHLLLEPVAASIAYFIDRPLPKNSYILVFDLGGGTLDVCIFKVMNKKLEIIGNAGDTNLGGRNFDNLLIKHFDTVLKIEYGIDVNATDKLKYRLMQKSMEIKHTLSAQLEENIDVSDFSSISDSFIEITRSEFEKMAQNHLKKIKSVIEESLSITDLNPNQISKVLLVGGACRMPMIQNLLKEIFVESEHCCEENPDEVVAIGAAYYAYNLSSDAQKNCSVI